MVYVLVDIWKSLAHTHKPKLTAPAQIRKTGPSGERMAAVSGTTVCDVQSEKCHVMSCRHSDVKFIGIVFKICLYVA